MSRISATIRGVAGCAFVDLDRVAAGRGFWPMLLAANAVTALSLATLAFENTTPVLAGYWAISLLYSLTIASMLLRSHDAALRRARIEKEVKKQSEIIALMLNGFSGSGSDWLWETGGDGRLTYASGGLAAGLAVPLDKLIGRRLDEIVLATEDAPGWEELLSAIRLRGVIDCAAVELHFATGRTRWHMTARPIIDENGVFQGYRGVAHDVTAEHRANEELIAAKEAAERSSASKSHFLAVMSHELRTPLNAIVGFAELLGSPEAGSMSDDSRAGHLRTIVDASRHLQNLISDILDASRIERGTMRLVEQETDAAELVEVAAKMCRDAAERTDTTIVARIIEGIELRCDMTRIKQVLINLITNALKFSPEGGCINVAFERLEPGGLAIAVSDSGVGIRSEDIERIFEPYVQADEGMARRFGGAGLGLAIARRIAILHDGNVTIESEFGVGTTARLVLPAGRVIWPETKPAARSEAA